MVYFDNAATTRVTKPVADAASLVMTDIFGNPSSLHRLGIEAENEISLAEECLKCVLGDRTGTVIFTGSGTESNNLALRGVMYARRRTMNEMVIDAAEHESVTAVGEELKKEGFTVHFVPPAKNGEGNIEETVKLVNSETSLVSLMMVNNETGSITDIKNAVSLIKRKNKDTLVHVDCIAALGKENINVRTLGADIYTFSGHKIHAPKGVGAIFIKKGVRLSPVYFPGGQGHGIRPGTEAVPLIAAFRTALEIAEKNMEENKNTVREINKYIREHLPEGVVINSPDNASPYILNISSRKVKSEIMIHFLEKYDIFVSGGSACSKGAKSHVLTGMGLGNDRIETALRISFSEENTLSDAREFTDKLALGLNTLLGSF